ncbi:hypothetical protein SAMN05216315_11816 [Nitrosospira sp. Nsp18]|uniref:DUF2971 domain-containing protein n=1 Tax=Nitrosospira sp. Nsp18 TaxID=1855334 RepID=UPI000884979F|nr:DUF2971 domain-containing protein [Nitrosospira sp. Nsp18]SDA22326.1 hypothetical protein SAMN05216315_11816 [Nitrosospira sp. Nsp18]
MGLNENILWHYCSAATFKAIISTQRFRMTATSDWNDATEGHFLESLVGDSALTLEEKKNFKNRAAKWRSQHQAFGICFSRQEDRLCQWRTYGEDGEGFAIGLDFKDPSIPIGRDDDIATLEIQYRCPTCGKDRTGELIKSCQHDGSCLVKILQTKLSMLLKPDDSGLSMQNFSNGYNTLEALWSTKSDLFNEEQEVRLLLRKQIDESGDARYGVLQIEDSGNIIYDSIYGPILTDDSPPKKRYELDLRGLNVIKKIIVGPRNNIEIEEVEKCVRSYGFNDVSVVKSMATGIYRGQKFLKKAAT